MRGIGCALVLGLTSPLYALEAMPVSGSVQFWRRACQGLVCTTPESVGARHGVRLELDAPTGPGAIGRREVRLREGDLELELHLLWPSPPDGSRTFVVAQGRLLRRDDLGLRPLAECSQYHDDRVERFFPVGACAGYVEEGALGRSIEYGVTFFKD